MGLIAPPSAATFGCSSSEPLRIACVGDSLTRGDALHELPQRHRVPAHKLRRPFHVELRSRGNYPALLQRLFGQHVHVRNFGHGGSTACNASELPYAGTKEYKRVTRWEPHVAVVMLGTNDAKGRFWRPGATCGPNGEGFQTGLLQILRALQAAASPPPMLLLVPPPPVLSDKFGIRAALLPPIRTLLRGLARQLQSEASPRRRGTRGCNAGEVALLEPGLPIHARRDAFIADGIHLNANATALIACAVHEALGDCFASRCERAARTSVATLQEADATDMCDATVGSGIDAPFVFTGMPCVASSASSSAGAAGRCAALLREARNRGSPAVEHEL